MNDTEQITRNARQRALMAKRARVDRTVIIPRAKSPTRRARCRRSLLSHLRTYHPLTYALPFCDDQKKVIATIQRAVMHGGHYAFAMPRGEGKTTICEGAVEWMALHGLKTYVVILASDAGAAQRIMASIKTEIETNDKLADDFPEVCLPVRELEGNNQRCKGQLARMESETQDKAERTTIEWGDDRVILPSVRGSVSAGTVIQPCGLTAGIRGLKYKRRDGTVSRPDFGVVDDPQTDESAKSTTQCEYREKLLTGTVLGLAGPRKKLSIVMPCTVIMRNDLAHRMADRKQHPDWQGEVMKLVYAWPLALKLWDEYADLRKQGQRDGDDGKGATEFYRSHRDEMDKGGRVAWEARKHPGELSAIQHAMNLRIDRGEAVFSAEFQNDPTENQSSVYALTGEIICSRTNGQEEYTAPDNAPFLAGFADMNQYGLTWAVCWWRNDLTGGVAAYGIYPGGGRVVWDAASPGGMTEEQAFFKATQELCTQLSADGRWHRGAEAVRLDLLMLDCGYLPNVAFQFVRHARLGIRVFPSRGRDAKHYRPSKPIGKPGDHWHANDWDGKGRVIVHDADYHRMHSQKAWLLPAGAPASLSVWGTDPRRHQRFAEQCAAEKLQEHVRGDTGDFYNWGMAPGSRNDWGDCITGCRVAALALGCQQVDGKLEIAPGAPVPIATAPARQRERCRTIEM